MSGVTVAGGSFVVVASGYADGPAQPLVKFLNEKGASRVTAVSHPLVAEGPGHHRLDQFERGRLSSSRVLRRPNRPPFTYAFDPITPARLPAADVWFGFNCLATAQGLVRRRVGLVHHVVHWNVDFVPDRFGKNLLTRSYEWLDRTCCIKSDGRVELSAAALAGRSAAYGLDPKGVPTEIIPMGAWNIETPKTSSTNLAQRRIVFLGHLVERMGVPLFIRTMALLRDRGCSFHADIVGGGPLLTDVRRWCSDNALDEHVTVHGFVPDFADVARLLASAVVAVAPYEVDDTSFTRFADPGKLKAYLSAGLPILLTDVPPNAAELAEVGGAAVLAPTASTFADEIERMLGDHDEWTRRHRAALDYAAHFDWGTMLSNSLPRLGIAL